jgi:hypothetical protein
MIMSLVKGHLQSTHVCFRNTFLRFLCHDSRQDNQERMRNERFDPDRGARDRRLRGGFGPLLTAAKRQERVSAWVYRKREMSRRPRHTLSFLFRH